MKTSATTKFNFQIQQHRSHKITIRIHALQLYQLTEREKRNMLYAVERKSIAALSISSETLHFALGRACTPAALHFILPRIYLCITYTHTSGYIIYLHTEARTGESPPLSEARTPVYIYDVSTLYVCRANEKVGDGVACRAFTHTYM